MYTEHNQTKKNKKALLLLLVLGVFGFVAFKYTKVKDIIAKDNTTEAATCPTTVTDNSYDLTSKFFVIDDSGNIADITPIKAPTGSTVLGSTTTSGNSCSTQNLATTQTNCTKTSNSVSINGKSFLASEVTIVLDKIKAPFILFSGSPSSEIENSNRNSTGIYKPAGEQYEKKQMYVNTTPGEGYAEMKAMLEGSPVKKTFGTQYSINTSDTSDAKPQGDIVVNQYLENSCVECNNISNPTPTKSNKSSIVLKNINFTTPISVNTSESSNTLEISNSSCSSSNRELSLISLINPAVCSNPWGSLAGTLGSLFPSFDWNKCDPKTDSNCVSTENLVVKMNPMFKETNEYMDARNSSAMDPKTSEKYTPYYILTSCKARIINNKTGSTIEADVKCVWDGSYLFYENEAAAYDDNPGSNDTMTDSQFAESLQKATVKRAVEQPLSLQ